MYMEFPRLFRLALKPLFPWQVEGSSYFPGAVSSVAHQFLRCVLHQLAPYGVFVQLFQSKFPGKGVSEYSINLLMIGKFRFHERFVFQRKRKLTCSSRFHYLWLTLLR